MSWRLLLSDYPTPLLTDELAASIISLVEWNGAVTEDDLSRQLGIDQGKLVLTLLALQRDQCVVYNRNFIQLDHRGKEIAERLTLHEGIIESIASHLFPEGSQGQIRELMLRYRARAFNQYLGCLAAVRSWQRTVSNFQSQDFFAIDFGASGSVAIILSDLARWLASDTAETTVGWAIDRVRPRIAYHQLGRTLFPNNEPSVVSQALVFLDHANDTIDHATPWHTLKSMPLPEHGFFAAHSICRARLEPTLFLEEWSPRSNLHVILESCLSGQEAVERVSLHGLRAWDYGGQERSVRHHMFGQAARGDLGASGVAGLSRDLLRLLLESSSLVDLEERTGLHMPLLRSLLTQIRDKCDALVTAPPDSRSGPAAPSQPVT